MENYRALYKVPAKSGKPRDEKRETVRREQKKKREDTFLERRNIKQQEPSSSAAPTPTQSNSLNVSRRDKLLKWKAEKDRLVAQQKLLEKKRPPFKAGVAHHALDPVKELVALPVRGTTSKCTTAKKAAAESRLDATEKRKAKPSSAAATSLASLAAPVTSSAFSGRITRSRAAAVASVSQAKASVKPVEKPKRAAATTRNPKTSNLKATSDKKSVKKVPETSFAPQDHKFKAPTSLTLPTTPLALKRSAARFKETAWPSIDGVGLLSSTSLEPSPKVAKTEVSAALLRKGRLSRSVKEGTAQKSSSTVNEKTPRKSLLKIKEKTPRKSPLALVKKTPRKSATVEVQLGKEKSPKTSPLAVVKKTPRKSATKEVQSVKDKTPRKSPLTIKDKTPKTSPLTVVKKTPSKSGTKEVKSVDDKKRRRSSTVKRETPSKSPLVVEEKSPEESPEVYDTINAEGGSAKKMPRLSRKSGGFIISDMHVPAVSLREEPSISSIEEETTNDVEMSLTRSAGRPKRSVNRKTRQSLKEKENVPAENKLETPSAEDSFSLSLPEADAMDSIIVDSRRMSIHEPSPPVYISPEKLLNGMVAAQFSPFVTSARGKDKYSLQKRRSSLIPIVPDVSAEELAYQRQVEHFRNMLERESSRLLTISALWEERMAELPPSVQDRILGPIGQARLLVKDKFQQFRKLVDKFESRDSDGNITTDDLTGFWEMILLTVENVDKRFQELEDLKENDWKEKPTEAVLKKTATVGASKPTKPRTQAQSRLKGLIEAARKRKQEAKQNKSTNVSVEGTSFDGGFFKVESPKKVFSSSKATNFSPASKVLKPVLSTPRPFQRRSLLQQVLTNSAARVQNSPGVSQLNRSLPLSASPKVAVAQMRASELGRRMSMDSGNDTFSPDCSSPVLKPEPTKSILKSAVRKSMRVNTPKNRVAFEVLNQSQNSSPGSPILNSPATPLSLRVATPGSRKRASLIPRPISTPKTSERASLLPIRQSLVPSRPLPNGDLIDFSSPKRASRT